MERYDVFTGYENFTQEIQLVGMKYLPGSVERRLKIH